MSASAGPNLVGIGRGGDSNLVLEMDAHDAKSYPGEPTSNLYGIVGQYAQNGGNHTGTVVTGQPATLPLPLAPPLYSYYKIVATGAWSSESNRFIAWPGTIGYAVSTSYRLSFWARTDSPGSQIRFSFYQNGLTNYATLTSEWQHFSCQSTTHSAYRGVEIGNVESGGQTYYVAAIQVEDKTYATPYEQYGARPASVNLMIHGDVGTGQTFSDSSPSKHTITTVGNTTHSAAQSKFSGGSVYFDGTGDYLTIPASGDWDVGTGDWTLDCWAYTTLGTSNAYLFDTRNSSNTSNFSIYRNGLTLVYYAQVASKITTGTVLTLNTWHHIALVRSGSTVTLYVDGASAGSATDASDYEGLAPFLVGTRYSVDTFWDGYQDEFRFTKGTALWTSAFTPPTRRNLSAPVVDRVNYNGFNCTSTAVTDQATYRDGEVIRLTTPTDALNNIKSAVWDFDGTDDKLFGGVASFDPTGPATINLWLNQDSGNNGITTCLGNASASDRYFNIHPSSTSLMRMGVVSSGGWQYKTFTDNLLDTWAMLTIVNTGSSASPSTYSVYLNGTSHADNPVTYTGSFSDPTDLFVLGNYTLNNSYDTLGQIANVQIYKVALTDQQVVENFNQQNSRFNVPNWRNRDIVKDGLVAWYDAGISESYPGSGTTWSDISGNGYDGTITGATYSTDGGGSLDFNGSSDDVNVGSNLVLKTEGGWTIESWVKADAVSGGPYNFTGHDSPDTVGWYWSVYNSKFAIWNKSPGVWKYGSTTLSTGVWMHCVCVSENAAGTSYQMYLNGVIEGGTSASYTFNGAGDYKNLEFQFIGRASVAHSRFWNGKYAVNRMYTKALSASEIEQNFIVQKQRFGV